MLSPLKLCYRGAFCWYSLHYHSHLRTLPMCGTLPPAPLVAPSTLMWTEGVAVRAAIALPLQQEERIWYQLRVQVPPSTITEFAAKRISLVTVTCLKWAWWQLSRALCTPSNWISGGVKTVSQLLYILYCGGSTRFQSCPTTVQSIETKHIEYLV